MSNYIGYEMWGSLLHGRENSGYRQIIEFEGNTENLAAFIASREFRSEYVVTDTFDNPVLTTNGKMIQNCVDKEFLVNDLLPKLIPMQRGDRTIPEVNTVREVFLGDVAAERETEEENELEF
ncbi:hypothetical protein [Enterococcus hulanensis]|uniref:hypothetical protein n=1 Tax=Enterococcus hulanensis TaxID=2559929 RepID=UPI0010F65756|nr:hypothetical protein [Enterococcus hulanensis]